MGGVLATIWEWAVAGCEAAVQCVKWIWEGVAEIIKGLLKLVQDTVSQASFSLSYNNGGSSATRETQTNVQTGTTREHVETHNDGMRLYCGFNDEGLRQRHTDAEKDFSGMREKAIERFELAERNLANLKDIMIQDRGHQDHQQTVQKLQDYLDDPDTKSLKQALSSLPKGSTNLTL